MHDEDREKLEMDERMAKREERDGELSMKDVRDEREQKNPGISDDEGETGNKSQDEGMKYDL